MPRPSGSNLKTLSFVVSMLVVLLAGCDDDGVRPQLESEPQLRGRVVGPQGGPVPEVVLSPLYFFDPPLQGPSQLSWAPSGPFALSKLRTSVSFVIPTDGPTRLTIEDAVGDTVRTLFDGVLQAGDHQLIWSADRDDGSLVPNGLYTLVLWHDPGEGDPVVSRREIFVLDVDVPALAQRPFAVTDADGRFSVPMALIPLGYEVQGYDSTGDSTVTYRVLPRFRLHAFRVEGETVVGESSTWVEILDPSRSKSVVVAMP